MVAAGALDPVGRRAPGGQPGFDRVRRAAVAQRVLEQDTLGRKGLRGVGRELVERRVDERHGPHQLGIAPDQVERHDRAQVATAHDGGRRIESAQQHRRVLGLLLDGRTLVGLGRFRSAVATAIVGDHPASPDSASETSRQPVGTVGDSVHEQHRRAGSLLLIGELDAQALPSG